MKALRDRCFIFCFLMLCASLLTVAIKPREKLAERSRGVDLEQMIPAQVDDWLPDPLAPSAVVNPQQQAVLSRIYTQTLARAYLNRRTGERVMLSIAYGIDQRDAMQLHYPEACYPAQGFQIRAGHDIELSAGSLRLPGRRLVATLGATRNEAITYWVMVGTQPVRGRWMKKLAEMRYGLEGVVPDGLLFRVSTTGGDTQAGYRVHDAFITALAAAIRSEDRPRFFGSFSGTAGTIDMPKAGEMAP